MINKIIFQDIKRIRCNSNGKPLSFLACIDYVAEWLRYHRTSHSELADAMLVAFFKTQNEPSEKERKLIILGGKENSNQEACLHDLLSF